MKVEDLQWSGGEHSFLLAIEQMRALQDRCDAGPEHIRMRLLTGQWLVDDVIQPIRLGLIGAGMEPEEARKLVKDHVEDKPLTHSVLIAQAILAASLYGPEDDPVGEQKGEETSPKTHFQEEKSNGQAS